ncbi:MAG: DUF4919 domain-containing protein [Bacteroidales bacterium]|nr:DUF4919 domain-containing protein [Bacteroidales bacterium]
MKKEILALAILLFLGAGMATAQEEADGLPTIAPTYDSIFSMVQNKKGPCYYDKLAKRFLRADTTLGLQELRCLYYGYPVQKGFDPYSRSAEQEAVTDILHGDNVSEADFKRAYKIAEKGLAKKPSDLILAYWKVIAAYYGFGEESKEFRRSQIQFEMLQVATASSGRGTAESPFFITSVRHSYMIMNIMGLHPKMQMLVYDTVHGYTCDAFPVEDDEGNADTLYFEVSQCMRFWTMGEQEEAAKVRQKVRIEDGTHFILRPHSIKREKSKFDIVLMETYNKPLSIHSTDSLFSEQGEAGTIEGYFGYDADTTHTLFITKNRCSKAVDFDSDIYYYEAMQWQSTSNHGNWPGAVGVEIWAGRISFINISNLRRKK